MEDAAKSKATYRHVAIVLGLLLVAAIGVAELPRGPLSLAAALGIASLKAALVAVYFMHLRTENTVNRVFAAGGLLWLVILIGLTLADYLTRG